MIRPYADGWTRCCRWMGDRVYSGSSTQNIHVRSCSIPFHSATQPEILSFVAFCFRFRVSKKVELRMSWCRVIGCALMPCRYHTVGRPVVLVAIVFLLLFSLCKRRKRGEAEVGERWRITYVEEGQEREGPSRYSSVVLICCRCMRMTQQKGMGMPSSVICIQSTTCKKKRNRKWGGITRKGKREKEKKWATLVSISLMQLAGIA